MVTQDIIRIMYENMLTSVDKLYVIKNYLPSTMSKYKKKKIIMCHEVVVPGYSNTPITCVTYKDEMFNTNNTKLKLDI